MAAVMHETVNLVKANLVSDLEAHVEKHHLNITDAVYELPDEDTRVLTIAMQYGNLTLGHVAAFYDCLDIFLWLEGHGLSITAQSAKGYAPLDFAVLGAAREVTHCILDRDPTQAAVVHADRSSLLYLAVVGGDLKILSELLRCGAPVEVRGSVDPVRAAIERRRTQCLRLLLESSGVRSRVSAGKPLLVMAAMAMDHGAALYLVQNFPCDVNWSSGEPEFNSALKSCLGAGPEWKDVVEELLELVDPKKIEPPAGMRVAGVAHWACGSRCLPLILRILEMPEVDVNRVDANGHTALFAGLGMRPEDLVEVVNAFVARGFKLEGENLSVVRDFLIGAIRPPWLALRRLFELGLDPMALVPPEGAAAPRPVQDLPSRPLEVQPVWLWLARAWTRESARLYVDFCVPVGAPAEGPTAGRLVSILLR